MIKARQQISGKLGYNTINVYPHLEDLKVEPKVEEQTFKSELYGYDNVTVEAIKTEDISVIPSREEQAFEGIYNKVNVKAIEEKTLDVTPSLEQQSFDGVYTNVNINPIDGESVVIDPKNEQQTFSGVYTDITVNEIQGDTLNITPSTQSQSFEGIYEAVNVNPITGEEITITPSATEQVKEGVYTKITVEGDDNLVPENIKKGINIFGVDGLFEGESIVKEYIELEYIESTGAQYIDTGYQPNSSTALEFEVSKISPDIDDAPMFSASSKWTNGAFIFTPLLSTYNWWYYSGDSMVLGDITTDEALDKIYLYRGYTKLNDEVITTNTTNNASLKADRNLILFSGPVTGPDGLFTKFRLHSFKIMSSGPEEEPVYIRDFIPAKMRDTGEIGLYDKAEEKFYASKGTETFIAGPELPDSTDDTTTPVVKDGVLIFNGTESIEGEVLVL